MINIMLDLETLGTRPGCKILSIGAVAFDKTGLGDQFYTSVDPAEQVDVGLHDDPDTHAWWAKQSAAARKVFTEPKIEVVQALTDFRLFCARHAAPKFLRLWGNGADFDNPILGAVYHAFKVQQPWGPYSNRCYRTLKSFSTTKIVRGTNVHHNALGDAVAQAEHAVVIMNALSLPD